MLIEGLADRFQLPTGVVKTIVATAPYRYKTYDVPKKSGLGTRLIAQPAREVKLFQKFIVENVLNDLPVHGVAMAYRKGRSIRQNSQFHIASNYLLKMDFEDFFPSLGANDLMRHISKYMPGELEEEDLRVVGKVCFWKPPREEALRLSIGGPSSPMISNTLMFDFDDYVASLCAQRKVKYTRYADDLTFSTREAGQLAAIEASVYAAVERIAYPSLQINRNKTVHMSKRHHRRVTGLVLSSEGNISLGRERKRNIRAMVYRALRDELDASTKDKLRGLLAFAWDVEPDFVDRLKQKFGAERVDALFGREG